MKILVRRDAAWNDLYETCERLKCSGYSYFFGGKNSYRGWFCRGNFVSVIHRPVDFDFVIVPERGWISALRGQHGEINI